MLIETFNRRGHKQDATGYTKTGLKLKICHILS